MANKKDLHRIMQLIWKKKKVIKIIKELQGNTDNVHSKNKTKQKKNLEISYLTPKFYLEIKNKRKKESNPPIPLLLTSKDYFWRYDNFHSRSNVNGRTPSLSEVLSTTWRRPCRSYLVHPTCHIWKILKPILKS